jgi:hypothetical protein
MDAVFLQGIEEMERAEAGVGVTPTTHCANTKQENFGGDTKLLRDPSARLAVQMAAMRKAQVLGLAVRPGGQLIEAKSGSRSEPVELQ